MSDDRTRLARQLTDEVTEAAPVSRFRATNIGWHLADAILDGVLAKHGVIVVEQQNDRGDLLWLNRDSHRPEYEPLHLENYEPLYRAKRPEGDPDE